MARRIEKIVFPANEQNLDRLTAEPIGGYTQIVTRSIQTAKPEIVGVAPFFIVRDVPGTLAFYRDRLGFEVTFEGFDGDIFFGIVERGRAMLMFKKIGVDPLPNHTRDVGKGEARWDAYFVVPDPDALAREYEENGVKFSEPLKDTNDGLRGFEVTDPNGYVLFFGRPE